jgi:hypothetical protein
MLCYFLLCDMFYFPHQVCPREYAQNQLLRHTFGAIELKITVLPILEIQNRKKYQKNKSKICKIWISTSALTLWWAPLSFRADRAVLFLSLWSTVPSQSDFPTGRAPNSNSQAPNSESGWCFKFRAKTCGISIGHTFYPIELKIGVLPLVIQNHKKLSKK